MTRLLLPLLLLLAAPVSAAEPTAQPAQTRHVARPGPESTPALKATLEGMDRQLFHLIFNRCDSNGLRALIAEDFEFYHDKHGQSANTGAQFIDSIAAMCVRQTTGEDYRSRRELDAASSEVFPLQGYGALHTGTHRFYMLEAGKPERLVETGRFSNLWKQQADGGWQLTRVLSYDHRTTD